MEPVPITRLAVLALISLVVAAWTSLAHGQAPPPPGGNSFVVNNVRVFDGERAVERANVVVRDGRIASVGHGRPPAGLTVVDGSGRTQLPGLIDAHAHVQSEAQLRNAARFGATTQLDMFTRVEFAQAQRGRRDSLARTDLADLWSAGTPVTSAGGMGTQFGIVFPTISGPAEADAFVRARLAEGSDYIKILYEPGVEMVTTIDAATLAAAVKAAHAQGRLAVVHITSLDGARAAVEARADGLVHLFADAVIDDALASRMAAQRMFVVPTLWLFAGAEGRTLGPELAADPHISPLLTEAQRKGLTRPPPTGEGPVRAYMARLKLDTALENVRRLRVAGVRMLAGDDAPNFGGHGVTLHGEMELLTRGGLTAAEALNAATRAPADAFRIADRGRIAPGARADLVLVDGNPLADIRATRAIVKVFKNGFEVSRAPPAPAAGGAR